MKNRFFKKITAVLSAAALTFTVTAPVYEPYAATDLTKKVELKYERFDPQSISDAGKKLKEACSKENNDDEVLSCYETVYDLFLKYRSACEYSTILTRMNSDYEEYDYEFGISSDVNSALKDALYDSFSNSQYKTLLEKTGPEDFTDYIRQIISSESDPSDIFTLPSDFLKKQNELVTKYSFEGMDVFEFEEKSAELYVDILKYLEEQKNLTAPDTGLTEYYFESRGRDYSPEDILKLKDKILDTFGYISEYIWMEYDERFMELDENDYDLLYSTYSAEKFFNDFVLKYSGEISDELYNSAKYLLDNDLLFTSSNSLSTGGVVFPMPYENTSVIYIGESNIYNYLHTVTHEFGHFNSALYSNVKNISNRDNLDIAELQSQGLEVLYYKYYSEILPEKTADFMILDRIVCQLSDIFEYLISEEVAYKAASELDTLTPERVIELYRSASCLTDFSSSEYYQPFTATVKPFYNTSYLTSELAMFSLLATNDEDYRKAVDKYIKISKTDTFDSETGYLHALEETGFENVLSEEYLDSLRFTITDYLDSIEGRINGDIDSNGVINSADLVALKQIMLGEIEEYDIKTADLNRDARLSASDLVEMIYRLTE